MMIRNRLRRLQKSLKNSSIRAFLAVTPADIRYLAGFEAGGAVPLVQPEPQVCQ